LLSFISAMKKIAFIMLNPPTLRWELHLIGNHYPEVISNLRSIASYTLLAGGYILGA
jgi:hypothetical protein